MKTTTLTFMLAGLGLLMAAQTASGADWSHRDRAFVPSDKAAPAQWVPVHRRGGFRGGFRGGYWRGPRWGSGFSFSFGGPVFGPRYYGPSYYYPAPVPYYYPAIPAPPPLPARAPDHCTSILDYAERRSLPSGWNVEAFNNEVDRCKALKYPALPPGSTYVPPPPPLTGSAPQTSSYFGADTACRNLAYQASGGGPGVDKTVTGGLLGGALGAAAGAAIGAVAGDPGIGAAIGAVAGGFTGAASNTAAADQDFHSAYANCMAGRGH